SYCERGYALNSGGAMDRRRANPSGLESTGTAASSAACTSGAASRAACSGYEYRRGKGFIGQVRVFEKGRCILQILKDIRILNDIIGIIGLNEMFADAERNRYKQ